MPKAQSTTAESATNGEVRRTATTAVCVVGMHRSGTSLVAKALHEAGLNLGPPGELMPANEFNADGYWENQRLVRLNDELLEAVGGAWDSPPPAGWEQRDSVLEPFLDRARALADEFSKARPWAWKDPRATLTLPFWRRIVPDLTFVVCVRHPVEVAASLARRGSASPMFALRLWTEYNHALLDWTRPEERVVTHYESYFKAPERELRRVFEDLGLEVGPDEVRRAGKAVNVGIRHHSAPGAISSPPPVLAEALELYGRLCSEAGPVYEATVELDGDRPAQAAQSLTELMEALNKPPDLREQEIARLRLELSQQADHLRLLQERLEHAVQREEELQEVLTDAHEQLFRRDETITRLESGPGRDDERVLELDRKVVELDARLRNADDVIRNMQATRAWRMGQRWWAIRDALKSPFKRR